MWTYLLVVNDRPVIGTPQSDERMAVIRNSPHFTVIVDTEHLVVRQDDAKWLQIFIHPELIDR